MVNIMKRLTLVLFITLLLPQIALAAWWNPFSWFDKSNQDSWPDEIWPEATKSDISNSNTDIQFTTFYIKADNVRVRTCPSTSCNIIGYFKTNDWVKIPENVGTSLDSLPEWIEINILNIGTGYVSKSLLSSEPVSVEEVTVKNNTANQASLSAGLKIVNDWINLIDAEIQITQELRGKQVARSASYYTEEAVDVLDEYISSISSIKIRLNSILNNIKSPYDMNAQVPQIDLLTGQYNELKLQLVPNIQIAIEQANIRASRDRNIRQEVISDAYRQAQAELGAINQARIDATNASTQKYNELLEAAKNNGVTQSVFNAQLQGAGLIPQSTYCTMSSTYGANYSIICN